MLTNLKVRNIEIKNNKRAGLITLLFCLLFVKSSFSQSKNENYFSKQFKTYYYTNVDSSLFYANNLERLYITEKRFEDALYINFNKVALTGYHYNQVKNKEVIDKLGVFLIKYKRQLPSGKKFLKMDLTYRYFLGSYYYEQNNFTKSQTVFQKIVDSTTNHSEINTDEELVNLMVNAITTLGTIAVKERNFDESNQLFEFVLNFLNNTKHKLPQEVPNAKFLYGSSLSAQEKYKESNLQLFDAFAYTSKNMQLNRMARITSLLSKNYNQLNKRDSALYYLNLQKTFLPPKHKFWEDHFISEYQLNKQLGNTNKAKQSIKKAIPFSLEKWGNENHPNVAKLYGYLSDVYITEEKQDSAQININKAINKVLSYEYKSLYNQLILLELYKTKAKIVGHNNPQEVINVTKKAIAIIDEATAQLNSDKDLTKFVENSYEIFDLGIQAAIKISATDDAFLFMEKSKAITLLKSFYNARAYSLAGVPKEITDEERALKTELAGLQKKGEAKNSERLLLLSKKLEDLIVKIEQEYPKYYELKYADRTVSINELREQINVNQTILSYFSGKEKLFVTAISKTDKKVIEIPYSISDKDDIISLYNLLKEPDTNVSEIKTLGKTIYKKYVQPLILKNTKQLTIIPDGLLSYIPFEALVNNNDEYLVQNYAISYAPSSSLWSVLEHKSSKNKVLGVAPDFSSSSYAKLPNNLDEVNAINSLFSTTTLNKENATKTAFLPLASDHILFHFATHAILNDEFPSQSYLAFANGNENDQDTNLTVGEVYNLDLQDTKMVTLSACDTSIGKLQKGEGFISLARAFFYGGTSSITSSLWQINDASTSKIISNYYKELANGNNKAVAMQLAKTAFLQENKDNGSREKLLHPYYWSAFVVSGNIDPIKSSLPFLTWLLPLGVLALGVFWWTKRKTV